MIRPIRRSSLLALTMIGLLVPMTAQAHFLWLVASPTEEPTEVKLYFSESASPDDPDLLERVAKAEAWIPGGRRSEPQRLTFSKKDDALVASIPSRSASSPVVLKHNYGVITRGKAPMLLNYCAKSYPSQLPGSWKAVSDKELLPLEITPSPAGEQMQFEVTWQGKPIADVQVVVDGPGLKESVEGVTNDQGVFACKLANAGLYSVRARLIEETSGEHDGEAYKSVRHYSTLSLPYAPSQLASAKHSWPSLGRGTTSFGAAVIGDWLYIYGGHYGQAHHYSSEGQSGGLPAAQSQESG